MGALYTTAASVRRRWLRLTGARTLGVRAIVLDPDGRILLVRHHYIGGWYLPGGGVDRGEGYAVAHARELHEEIGVTRFATERLLGLYHATGEGRDDHVAVYVVRLDADEAAHAHAADPREIADIRWCAPGALPADTTPATQRRIAEFAIGAVGGGTW